MKPVSGKSRSQDFSSSLQAQGRICGGRIRLLLDLVTKLNTTFVRAMDLDEVLEAVLVGVTAGEGLGFNRAFWVELDQVEGVLKGKMGIGPCSHSEAQKIWAEMNLACMSLTDILEQVREDFHDPDLPVNLMVRRIQVSLGAEAHVLVQCVKQRRAFCAGPGCESGDGHGLSYDDVCRALSCDTFAAAPVYAEDSVYGVVVADNFVTSAPVTQEDLDALQLFASLGAIAMYKAGLCQLLHEKIQKLTEVNRQIEANKDSLVQAERMHAVGRMAEQLSHEIRNPLSAVGGMARILDRKLQDPALKQYVDTIVNQAKKVEDRLGTFFDFAVTPELHKEPVRPYQLMEASVALMKSEMDRRSIASHLRLDGTDPVIMADRLHLQQAFINLIKNAVEAMPEGGLLLVTVSNQGDQLQIQVTDSGKGMSKGQIEMAGAPFFTTKGQALGLGLSLARQVVELHGGRFQLEVNGFRGITATIFLPVELDGGGEEGAGGG